jgi:DNA ligase-1
MQRFSETADSISGTTSKLKKIAFLADYLRTLNEDDLRSAAVFFTGRPFALTDARTLNVGWSALMNAVQEISGASDEDIHQVYLARGDLGEMAERLLAGHEAQGSPAPAAVQAPRPRTKSSPPFRDPSTLKTSTTAFAGNSTSAAAVPLCIRGRSTMSDTSFPRLSPGPE